MTARARSRAVALATLALAAPAAACATSPAASGGQARTAVDVASSVLPIAAGEAILPIVVRGSVLPLESVQAGRTKTTVTLSADVLFAFNRARLAPAARRAIARIAKRLEDVSGVVRVDGYTDGVGSSAYNLRLSRRRARAVVAALAQATAGATRFSARGHGESDPVAPNSSGGVDDPAGRALNRRVTISYGR